MNILEGHMRLASHKFDSVFVVSLLELLDLPDEVLGLVTRSLRLRVLLPQEWLIISLVVGIDALELIFFLQFLYFLQSGLQVTPIINDNLLRKLILLAEILVDIIIEVDVPNNITVISITDDGLQILP